jgi:hypothetical protein
MRILLFYDFMNANDEIPSAQVPPTLPTDNTIQLSLLLQRQLMPALMRLLLRR